MGNLSEPVLRHGSGLRASAVEAEALRGRGGHVADQVAVGPDGQGGRSGACDEALGERSHCLLLQLDHLYEYRDTHVTATRDCSKLYTSVFALATAIRYLFSSFELVLS